MSQKEMVEQDNIQKIFVHEENRRISKKYFYIREIGEYLEKHSVRGKQENIQKNTLYEGNKKITRKKNTLYEGSRRITRKPYV